MHNVFCITVWELNHKYYLYLCWAVPPIGCLHGPSLLGVTPLGSSGATSIWHSCLHGTFLSVVFIWHIPVNKIMQKCVSSHQRILGLQQWKLLIWQCTLTNVCQASIPRSTTFRTECMKCCTIAKKVTSIFQLVGKFSCTSSPLV